MITLKKLIVYTFKNILIKFNVWVILIVLYNTFERLSEFIPIVMNTWNSLTKTCTSEM